MTNGMTRYHDPQGLFRDTANVMPYVSPNIASPVRDEPGDGVAWPFEPLQPLAYDVIMADPPWLFQLRSDNGGAKSPQAQYRCMPTAAIAALPVSYLARGDAWLFLWATYPMLPDALEVMKAWGFGYVTGGTWVKRGQTGKLAMGPGYVLRSCAEPFLIGRIGQMPRWSRSTRNLIEAPRREHSRKPDAAYTLCETLFGPAWRADLFSRETRPGWDAWGIEAGKFDTARSTPPPRGEPSRTRPVSHSVRP